MDVQNETVIVFFQSKTIKFIKNDKVGKPAKEMGGMKMLTMSMNQKWKKWKMAYLYL